MALDLDKLKKVWVDIYAGDIFTEEDENGEDHQVEAPIFSYRVGITLKPFKTIGKSEPGISISEYQEIRTQIERYLSEFVSTINRMANESDNKKT